jgi:hypothetical protein
MSSRGEFALDGIDEVLILVDLTDRSDLEAIVVTLSGHVRLVDLVSGKSVQIGKLSFEPFTEERRHPLFSAGLKLRSFRDYVAIVQDYGQHGTVFDLSDPSYSKELGRQSYHPDVCKFPVALFDRHGETWLIHATDWNRLDITRMEGDELLTNRVVSYETDENYFDYFHCGISVAPDGKSFVSNGWHWHPYGQITSYSVDGFLKDFEKSHIDLCLTDAEDPEDAEFELGWDRPLCWIDNKTLGIAYNRGEGWSRKRAEFPSEILIYDLASNRIDRRIPFDGLGVGVGGEMKGDLFFDKQTERLICIDEKTGLLISDLDGAVRARRSDLAGWRFNPMRGLFYRAVEENKKIEMISIETICI